MVTGDIDCRVSFTSNDEEVIDRLCELSDDEKLRIEFSLQTSEFIRRNTTLPLLMLFMKH